MSERTYLVTGATSGIGRATALGLARHGARVVILGRDQARNDATVDEIVRTTGNQNVASLLADLSSQSSIRRAAEDYQRRYSQLHVPDQLCRSAQAKSRTQPRWAGVDVRHQPPGPLSPHQPVPRPAQGERPGGRVHGHRALHDQDWTSRTCRESGAFGPLGHLAPPRWATCSSLSPSPGVCQGSGVVANAYHPGLAHTHLMREAPLIMRLLSRPMYLFAASPDRAAAGLVRLALDNAGGANGKFYHRDKVIRANAYALDEAGPGASLA